MAQGVDGLLRDKTRPSRIPRLPATVHERTVALTQTDPPGEMTHWTAQMMAKQVGISVSSRPVRMPPMQSVVDVNTQIFGSGH